MFNVLIFWSWSFWCRPTLIWICSFLGYHGFCSPVSQNVLIFNLGQSGQPFLQVINWTAVESCGNPWNLLSSTLNSEIDNASNEPSLPPSFSSASDGSVFQSDGKNRQGKEDVISDTVYVTGHYRPEIGECLVVRFVFIRTVVESPKSRLMFRRAAVHDKSSHRGLFHWSFWPSGKLYSGHILLSGSTAALFIEFKHIFRETDGRKSCEKIH